MDEEHEKALKHFGVMGMRWGKVKSAVGGAASRIRGKIDATKQYVKTANLADKNQDDMVEMLTAKRKKGFSIKAMDRMSDKEINDLAESPAMSKHLSEFRTARTAEKKKALLKLAVMAATYLAVSAALSPRPKMTINFDRRPRPADPFFKATIKKVVPKLLPGG